MSCGQAKADEQAAQEVAKINQISLSKPSNLVGEDYYQSVVVDALLGILRDHSLSSNHHHVIDAVMSIFKTQGLRSVAHLPQVCMK
jgi:FKBP12-rapamycin complex-associated protein